MGDLNGSYFPRIASANVTLIGRRVLRDQHETATGMRDPPSPAKNSGVGPNFPRFRESGH